MYVHDRESSLRRPYKELKGFAKIYLEPGESREVEVGLDKFAFSYYDDGQKCWVAEEGVFDRESGESVVPPLWVFEANQQRGRASDRCPIVPSEGCGGYARCHFE